MSNWLKLEGDVCAVTGALGGMGVEICREFARNGANVVMLDLDEEKVKAAAADLAAEFGIHAEGYKMNATDEAEVQAAVDATIANFGRVDVLVNTAGILRFAAMEDLPLSDWEQVLNVNLTGYFITSQRFGREMIKAGQGRLVHISTVASHSPETFSGVYSSTKAGVNMMSKMLAAEWGPYGVRSNCVEPCFVKTPMSANFYADPEVEKSRSRLIATRRIGEVSDIANAVMFLASKRSDFTTGDAIKVDGGFSNMMGDLTAKPGGRRAYADNYLKNKRVETNLTGRPRGHARSSPVSIRKSPMASTNSNKGRAVVLSAACVTMFFISSIALYSVVSKNLLAVYPEWSSALTWAFPVFQTIMAVTGIFAGRISDKIGPRNVVIAAAVCYGLGWFMSVLPVVLARRRHRQRPGLQPGAHHRTKVVHRQEGSRLRHHPGRFDRRPRRAVPGARLAAHPEPGHLWRPQGARRHLLCDDCRLRPVPEGPRGRLAARGLRGPQGRRACRHLR